MRYDVAQICENGHVISSYHLSYPESSQKYCDKCGAPTIIGCPHRALAGLCSSCRSEWIRLEQPTTIGGVSL
jgi:hypothetical protein